MNGDSKIVCSDCKQEFFFGEQEQAFYKEKGFVPPKRCQSCRQKRKNFFNSKVNIKKALRQQSINDSQSVQVIKDSIGIKEEK